MSAIGDFHLSNNHPLSGISLKMLRSAPFMILIVVLCILVSGCISSATSSKSACMQGVEAFHLGNYAQASVQFQKALRENPQDADALYNMGAVYHQLWIANQNSSDAAQAEQYYRDALNKNPNMAEAYRAIAVLMTTQGRRDEAFQTLRAWALRDQMSAAPRLELARLCEEQGYSDAAVKYINDALKVEPDNPRALAAYGRLREKTGDTNGAMMCYVQAQEKARTPELQNYIAYLQNSQNGGAMYAANGHPPQTVPTTYPATGVEVASNNAATATGSTENRGLFSRLSNLFSPSGQRSSVSRMSANQTYSSVPIGGYNTSNYNMTGYDTSGYMNSGYDMGGNMEYVNGASGAYPMTEYPTNGTTYPEGGISGYSSYPVDASTAGYPAVPGATNTLAPSPEQLR